MQQVFLGRACLEGRVGTCFFRAQGDVDTARGGAREFGTSEVGTSEVDAERVVHQRVSPVHQLMRHSGAQTKKPPPAGPKGAWCSRRLNCRSNARHDPPVPCGAGYRWYPAMKGRSA